MKTIKTYLEFSKSGIVTLVLLSVFGGYFVGHPLEQKLDWLRLIEILVALLFLASGSSALNQVQERHLDAQMKRTANRPLPSGRLSLRSAIFFVVLSIAIGLTLLYHLSNELLLMGVLAVLSYNGLYTLWWKKKWAFAAVPGAIPGALPILMGHVAAQGDWTHPGAWYLFGILFFWQMPHFWVLALKYREDYSQGGFPTLPVAKGMGVTVLQIGIWCLAYLGLAWIAPLFLQTGWIYWTATTVMSIKILWELYLFAKEPLGKRWIHFFLWINFSLVLYLFAAAADLWSVYLVPLIFA